MAEVNGRMAIQYHNNPIMISAALITRMTSEPPAEAIESSDDDSTIPATGGAITYDEIAARFLRRSQAP
jgi:hypothetical protein